MDRLFTSDMPVVPTPSPARIVRALDGPTRACMPPALHGDEDLMRRAMLIMGMSAAMVLCGALGSLLTLVLHRSVAIGFVVVAATLTYGLVPVLLRASGNILWATHLMCASAMVCIGLSTAMQDGLSNPALIWSVVPPLIATVVGGRRMGILWSAIAVAVMLLLLALDVAGLIPSGPDHLRGFGRWWSNVLLVLVVVSVAILYESLRNNAIEALHAAQHALARAREQQVLAERMASLGTLAAGVAHEINNPITFIGSNVDFTLRTLLRQQGPIDEKTLGECQQALQEAAVGVVRVRDIVKDLRTFARADHPQNEPVDCVSVVKTSTRMVGNEMRHRAVLTLDLQPVPLVMVHESQLAQVMVNLLTNAVQALPERDATQNQVHVSTSTSGTDVVLEVRDNGCGMDADVMRRIFDPFFTTKPVGVGTGLGLSICHRLVTGMGGRLEVRSRPGVGSAFRVVIPAMDTAPAMHTPAAPLPVLKLGRARKRLLAVDDEPQVTNALRRLLGEVYEVEVANSGREALRHIKGGTYDYILCDLMMPDMTGMDLYARVEENLPEMAGRMAFMTGGTFTPAANAFVSTRVDRCVDKPFTRESIMSVLAQLEAA